MSPETTVHQSPLNDLIMLMHKADPSHGCSRHMTENRSYLTNYEEIDGGFVSFGGTKACDIIGGGKKDTEDPGNKDNEAPITEELRVNQEKDSVNSTNRVNAVSSTVNIASNEVNVGRKSSIKLLDDPNMPELGDISIFKDLNKDVFGVEDDLNNLESTFQVSPILITRIHKDHPL
nr:hypothetical protein [Tanacetum cinerariifolium]